MLPQKISTDSKNQLRNARSVCCSAPVKKGIQGLECTLCKRKDVKIYFI